MFDLGLVNHMFDLKFSKVNDELIIDGIARVIYKLFILIVFSTRFRLTA